MIIHTPSVDMVGIIHIERVVAPAEHILGVLCVRLLDCKCLFALVPRLQLTANLSGVSVAPSIHLLALGQGHSMLGTACNFLDTGLRALAEDIWGNSGRYFHLSGGPASDNVLKC